MKSYAKINLVLYVLGKRNDGYHEILSVIAKIDLFDYIELKPARTLEIFTNIDSINNENNLSFKAAVMFFGATKIKDRVRIEIKKHIPIASGLGGPSSNAVYTLLALNYMFGFPLSFNALYEIAVNLGSDCPFFLYPNISVVSGRGEKVYPLDLRSYYPVLLVKPPFGVSTKEAYRNLILTKPTNINRMSLVKKLGEGILSVMHNDLEKSVFSLYPQIQSIKEALAQWFEYTLLSGSGASVFSIITDSSNAKSMENALDSFGSDYFIKETQILGDEGRDIYEHYGSED